MTDIEPQRTLTERREAAFRVNMALALATDMKIGDVARMLVEVDEATPLLVDVGTEL